MRMERKQKKKKRKGRKELGDLRQDSIQCVQLKESLKLVTEKEGWAHKQIPLPASCHGDLLWKG